MGGLKRMRTKWFFSLGITSGLVILGVLAVLFKQPYEMRGSEIKPALAVEDFTLTDQWGNPFTMYDYQGKVMLLFFGYTHCPDVCPLTLAKYLDIQKKLGSRAENVLFVFITVDPERDTPEVIRGYLAYFDTNFIGLSGSRSELEPVWKNYGVYQEQREVNSAAGTLVDHTARIYAIDRNGSLRVTYALETDVNAVALDVAQLLSER
jgi:protein SCO1/2